MVAESAFNNASTKTVKSNKMTTLRFYYQFIERWRKNCDGNVLVEIATVFFSISRRSLLTFILKVQFPPFPAVSSFNSQQLSAASESPSVPCTHASVNLPIDGVSHRLCERVLFARFIHGRGPV